MHSTHLAFRFCWIFPLFLCSCDGMVFKRQTPKAFLNHTIAPPHIYTADRIKAIKQLTAAMLRNEDFFSSDNYDDSTALFVDTILYAPDFNKLAIFIITKNSTSKQLYPERYFEWYYEGTCYLATRQQDTLDLYFLGPGYTNSYERPRLVKIMHDDYFHAFTTTDTTGPYAYKYNLNDTRFWTSDVWQRKEEAKAQRKAFEEERIKHPENVYIPPRVPRRQAKQHSN